MRPAPFSSVRRALLVLAFTLSATAAAEQPAQRTGSSEIKEFGIWIAIAALIAGLGKFLDDYYVGKGAKDRIRSALIRGFVFLETPLLSRLNPFGPPNLWMIWFTLAYMASLFMYSTVIDRIGTWSGNPWFIAYLKVPSASILLSAASLSILWVRNFSFWLIERSIKRLDEAGPPPSITDQPEAVRQLAVALVQRRVRWMNIVGLALLVVWAVILGRHFPQLHTVGEAGKIIAYAFVPTLLLYVLFYAVIVFLLLLNVAVKLVQKIIQHTFDKGSAPTTAPFTYFGALIGLLVLIAKIAEASLK
jgi:hypothetical protein